VGAPAVSDDSGTFHERQRQVAKKKTDRLLMQLYVEKRAAESSPRSREAHRLATSERLVLGDCVILKLVG
jgi:hypothetical protein